MRINDIQFNAELEDILAELVAQLRANGSQLIAKQKDGPEHIQICCPYHNNGMERRPSAGIRKSDGLLHCFACGEVHSLPEVITHCFGYDEDIVGTFGWKWLLKNFATVQVEERRDVDLDFVRSGTNRIFNNNISVGENERNSRCSEYNSEKYVSQEELDSYRYIHPYMYKRGLNDDIIELFDIGYDRDAKTITFPVRDVQGNCLFVARRSVLGKYYSYPAGAVKPLYGLYELYRYWMHKHEVPKTGGSLSPDGKISRDVYGEIVVCEGMFDALTCWVYGKPAVALNGLGNELQFKQLRDLPCRKLILATDNDRAGQQARQRIRKNVTNKLITEYILPNGKKDINELTEEEFLCQLQEVF